MKQWKMLVCVLAMLSAIPLAKAQDFSSSGGGLGFGAQYWHLDDMDDIWDSGGMWGGGMTIRIRPMKYIGIDLHAAFLTTQCDDLLICDRTARDARLWSVPLEAGLVVTYPIQDILLLYGGGGFGYYFYGEEAEILERRGRRTVYTNESIDCKGDPGWYAVAGVNLRLGQGVSLFAEGRYTASKLALKNPEKYSDGDHTFSDNDTNGFGAQIGLMFGL